MRPFFSIILVSVFLIAFSAPALAQEESAPGGWVKEAIGNLSGSQAGFQNWAEGGINTLAFTVGLDGKAERTTNGWTQKHTGKLSFGLVQQDTLDFRKAEDLIRFSSTFNYEGDGFLNHIHPTIALQARTQFAPGFNFKKNPFDDGRAAPVKVSDFLSPGTFTQSIGMTYQPREWVSQRLGIGGKQTVVLIEDLRSLYNVDADKNVRYEAGIMAFTDFDKEIFKNVNLKSMFGVFAAFNQPEHPDMIWENVVNMKVNAWLNVNFEWVMLFDDDVSAKAQMKEIFSLGISYHFI
ncbi:MAG: DUF3078 domain-containing protein [Bacteroidetes Order II. Incertae sedis bacterium]|nr:DUF3078 domain-containing protein [Bacteroidetes Order II. bacterium]